MYMYVHVQKLTYLTSTCCIWLSADAAVNLEMDAKFDCRSENACSGLLRAFFLRIVV